MALSFKKSAEFAIDKRAGIPCPNLLTDFGCGIHAELPERGFGGCVTYDCFGAGQQVSQVMFQGRDWRAAPATAERMFQVLPAVRDLHRLLWFITEALDRSPVGLGRDQLQHALRETELLTNSDPDGLSWGEVDRHRIAVEELLIPVSRAVRTAARSAAPDRNLPGADFRGADLRGVDLAGRDLRCADLRGADLLDANLGGADLGGANLTGTIFLLQSQLDAAVGDASTLLSPPLTAPGRWVAAVGRSTIAADPG